MSVQIVPNKPPQAYHPLTPEAKIAIVKWNAQYLGPTEIMGRLKEEFGFEVSCTCIQKYNPDKASGKNLSPELRDVFFKARRAYAEETEPVAGSVRNVRLQRLDDLYFAATKKGDLRAAVAAVTASRREMEKFEVVDDEEEANPWPEK